MTVLALPVTLIAQVPVALVPSVLGTSRLTRALVALMAPVPPLLTFSAPPNVITPDVVTGPPVALNPVVPPETLTDVTVPPPPPDSALFSRLRKNRYQSRATNPDRSSMICDWIRGICGSLSLGIGARQN